MKSIGDGDDGSKLVYGNHRVILMGKAKPREPRGSLECSECSKGKKEIRQLSSSMHAIL